MSNWKVNFYLFFKPFAASSHRFSSSLYSAQHFILSHLTSFPALAEERCPHSIGFPPPWFTLRVMDSGSHAVVCKTYCFACPPNVILAWPEHLLLRAGCHPTWQTAHRIAFFKTMHSTCTEYIKVVFVKNWEKTKALLQDIVTCHNVRIHHLNLPNLLMWNLSSEPCGTEGVSFKDVFSLPSLCEWIQNTCLVFLWPGTRGQGEVTAVFSTEMGNYNWCYCGETINYVKGSCLVVYMCPSACCSDSVFKQVYL